MARFELDAAFERKLLESDFMRARIQTAAEAAASAAADRAPDDPRTSRPDLPTSIVAEMELTEHGWRGRVVAHDWKAAWHEEGAAGVPARPFLRPSVEENVGPIEPHPEGD